jgi:hypothetical protein
VQTVFGTGLTNASHRAVRNEPVSQSCSRWTSCSVSGRLSPLRAAAKFNARMKESRWCIEVRPGESIRTFRGRTVPQKLFRAGELWNLPWTCVHRMSPRQERRTGSVSAAVSCPLFPYSMTNAARPRWLPLRLAKRTFCRSAPAPTLEIGTLARSSSKTGVTTVTGENGASGN